MLWVTTASPGGDGAEPVRDEAVVGRHGEVVRPGVARVAVGGGDGVGDLKIEATGGNDEGGWHGELEVVTAGGEG